MRSEHNINPVREKENDKRKKFKKMCKCKQSREYRKKGWTKERGSHNIKQLQ